MLNSIPAGSQAKLKMMKNKSVRSIIMEGYNFTASIWKQLPHPPPLVVGFIQLVKAQAGSGKQIDSYQNKVRQNKSRKSPQQQLGGW